MDQRSKNKVKLFRTLKVVFYCLGLPLFALAVVLTAATEYAGELAYAGMAETELFASMKVLFNGTALYGVWVAAGVWLLIAIVHIVLVKTVKNRRARTLLVGIVTLVVMLVPVVVMDLVIPVKLDQIQQSLPEGVTLASYEDEKGHFYTRTSASWTPSGKYESNNYYFVTGVENFLNTYKIGMYGGTKGPAVNNTSNAPVTYGDLFLYENGKGTAVFENESAIEDRLVKGDAANELTTYVRDDSGNVVAVVTTKTIDEKNGVGVRVKYWEGSSADGEPTITKDFNDYYFNVTNGLYYRTSAKAEMRDGIYGYASYNSNGNLSDGYVFGIDVALEILEDYYYTQKRMTEISNEVTLASGSIPSDAEIKLAAQQMLDYYYTEGEASDYEKWLYSRQDEIAAKYSLTTDELRGVLDALGMAIGDKLGDQFGNLLGLVGGVLGLALTDPTIVAGANAEENGLYVYVYTQEDLTTNDQGQPVIKPDAVPNISVTAEVAPSDDFGGERVITISLGGAGLGATETIRLGLDSRLIDGLAPLLDGLVANAQLVRYTTGGGENGTDPVYYASVAEIVYDAINGGSEHDVIGIVGTIVGIVQGLIPTLGDIFSLFTFDTVTEDNGQVTVQTSTADMLYGVVGNVLNMLYWYSSAEIMPVYNFYDEAIAALYGDEAYANAGITGFGAYAENEYKDEAVEYAEMLSLYDRAVYEGGMHGYIVGSTLIPGTSLIAGDTLGDGSYSAAVPASYEEVVLFKAELSYKRWLYPLLGVRECLVCFLPFVLLFIILSGVAAEKEMLYATGQEVAKKSKKERKAEKAAGGAQADGAADAVTAEPTAAEEAPQAADVQQAADMPSGEDTAPLDLSENDKEVL